MGKDLGFPLDWCQIGFKNNILITLVKYPTYVRNIFVIIEGQRGERTQFVPKGYQNTEFSRCMQKI